MHRGLKDGRPRRRRSPLISQAGGIGRACMGASKPAGNSQGKWVGACSLAPSGVGHVFAKRFCSLGSSGRPPSTQESLLPGDRIALLLGDSKQPRGSLVQSLREGRASFLSACGPQVGRIPWKLVHQMGPCACLHLLMPGPALGSDGGQTACRPGPGAAEPSTLIPMCNVEQNLLKCGHRAALRMFFSHCSPSCAGETEDGMMD